MAHMPQSTLAKYWKRGMDCLDWVAQEADARDHEEADKVAQWFHLTVNSHGNSGCVLLT